MKKLSLQWRLTLITTLFIAIICGCLTMFVYGSGVYYMDSLQETVDAQNTDGDDSHQNEIYISIPDDKWDDFANDFSVQVYNNKADYKKKSLFFSIFLAILGGVATYYFSGRSLKPLKEFSEKIEEVEARNLSDSRIEENKVKELNQLSISYNKMLDRLSESFEMQRQFTANAAHELRTPLAVMQAQLDLYHTTGHPATDACTEKTIQMVTDQNERLSKMVKTLLDMSELQTVARDEKIEVDALVEEVLADLDPLAEEKNVILESVCDAVTMMGSDILIYRVVYNLVENAIKYNIDSGWVRVTLDADHKYFYVKVADSGIGIPEDSVDHIFERFFRVDKARSREVGGTGLGLSITKNVIQMHHGVIDVESTQGEGTTFSMRIPLNYVSRQEERS